jgi:glucose/arabinose dehydrogenase
MRALKLVAAIAATTLMAFGSAVHAGPSVKLEKVVSGINTPLSMVQPAGDSRMFITEQNGRIKILENGKITGTFLDIRSKIVPLMADFDERGLLEIGRAHV